jgi:regulatory protein
MERMRVVADQEQAYQRAMRLLAARPRATHELLRRLKLAGHNPSAAAHAVGRLEGQGLLDDAEFARHFARTRAPRGHGPGRLLHDLLARGVERRTAELAIAETQEAEGTDPSAQAEALARKRAAQLAGLDTETKLRRIVGFLGRRGFVSGDIVAMVRRIVRDART